MKALLIVAALAAPALAQPAPPTPAAPPQPLVAKLTVAVGSETRVHELSITDRGCHRVEDKAAKYEDEVQVCTQAGAQGVLVEVEWRTRNDGTEYRTSSATVMKRGGRFEVGRTGTRFSLQLL